MENNFWKDLMCDHEQEIKEIVHKEAQNICDKEADLESPAPYHEDVLLYEDGRVEISAPQVDDSYRLPEKCICLLELTPHSWAGVEREIESVEDFDDWALDECLYRAEKQDSEEAYTELGHNKELLGEIREHLIDDSIREVGSVRLMHLASEAVDRAGKRILREFPLSGRKAKIFPTVITTAKIGLRDSLASSMKGLDGEKRLRGAFFKSCEKLLTSNDEHKRYKEIKKLEEKGLLKKDKCR